MLVAGFILLGWVLARRTILQRRRAGRESQASGRALSKLRDSKPAAVPLCDAPVETQRWQVALFDLQRDLKADLDTRIAIVQSLIRQADQRIEHLSRLQRAGGPGPSGAAPEGPSEAAAGEAADSQSPGEAAGTLPSSEASAGRADLEAIPEFRQIAELARRGYPAAEIAERLGQPVGDVELALATLSRDER